MHLLEWKAETSKFDTQFPHIQEKQKQLIVIDSVRIVQKYHIRNKGQ